MKKYFKVKFHSGGDFEHPKLIVVVVLDPTDPSHIFETCRKEVVTKEGVVSASHIFEIEKVEW